MLSTKTHSIKKYQNSNITSVDTIVHVIFDLMQICCWLNLLLVRFYLQCFLQILHERLYDFSINKPLPQYNKKILYLVNISYVVSMIWFKIV